MSSTLLQSVYKLRLVCFRNVVSSNLKELARPKFDECKNLNCQGFKLRATLSLLDVQNQIDQGIKDIENVKIYDQYQETFPEQKDKQKLPCGFLKYDDQESVCKKVERIVNI